MIFQVAAASTALLNVRTFHHYGYESLTEIRGMLLVPFTLLLALTVPEYPYDEFNYLEKAEDVA